VTESPGVTVLRPAATGAAATAPPATAPPATGAAAAGAAGAAGETVQPAAAGGAGGGGAYAHSHSGADAAAAWRALRDLRRAAGGLAAGWPLVPALLAAMDAEHVRRAGELLARVDPADVRARHPSVTAVAVTITGSSTLDGLVPMIAAETARHGLAARTTVSGLGAWFADLGASTAPGWADPADLRLCVLDAHAVFAETATPWTVEDVRRALDGTLDRLTAVADAAERAAEQGVVAGAGAGSLLVLNTVPLTALHAHQLVDHRSRMRLGAAWREFNAALLRLGVERRSVIVIDMDVLAAGAGPLEDPRLRAHTRTHFADDVLAGYAREVGHLAAALTGRTRKCLVLDLDGTLWGGVLGEDGPAGVVVGPDGGGTGEAFAAFGRLVRQLGSQGVLLAVCSKNDPGPVDAALRGHPGLPLRDDDFAVVVAGWEPKDAGLATIARRLDLGVDSLVFVDDSAFERGLVRAALPEVALVAVDGDEPARHADALLADGWFDTLELTAADRGRGADYRRRAARTRLRERCDTLADYLAELAVEVDVSPAAGGDAGRIAQLTQRTNQFNLTTRRMTPADVDRLVAAAAAAAPPPVAAAPIPAAAAPPPAAGAAPGVRAGAVLPLAIRYRDRFGDLGIVGAAFLRLDGEPDHPVPHTVAHTVAHIDNLLLSCRVFGRGVEQACVAGLAETARGAGAGVLRGHYASTAKNARFADFYPRSGFTPVPGEPGAFDLDLSRPIPPAEHPVALTVGGTPAAAAPSSPSSAPTTSSTSASPAAPASAGSGRTRRPDPKGGPPSC
jgi:FkbH-like protein